MIALILPAVALLAASAAPGAGERPNIVFILIDDMGWADLSCYGNKFDETPHIDRLARQGVRFTDFYSAGAVCSPTRASIQSGRYQARIGLTAHIPGHWRPFEKLIEPENAHFLPLETVTVGEALKAAGYRTGYFGKWHLNWNGGRDEGFDFLPDKQGYDVWSAGGPRRRPGAPPGTLDPKRIENLTDLTCKFIEDHRDGPFFVTLSHYAVHIPIEAKPGQIKKYVEKPKPPEGVNNPVYAAMVAHTDQSVGRILQKLDELELADNTLVVFSSDNGGLFRRYDGYGIAISSNAPLRGEKGSLYEGGIRVPTIVRWPGVAKRGGVCCEPTISIDFYPTFLEAACVGPSKDLALDGESLVPLFKNPRAELPRDAIFFHYPHYHHCRPSGAVRQRNFKLIEFFDTGETELYDLEKDLSERIDLSETMPEKARKLRARLAAWRASVGARMPRKNPRYDPARAGQWWSRRTGKPLDEEALKRNYEAEKAMMKKWTGEDWQ